MRSAKHAAEAVNRAKSGFLAKVSHKLATPMTAILGFSETLLLEGNLKQAPASRMEVLKTDLIINGSFRSC